MPDITDMTMMTRCIDLSRIAVSKGEYPFATVIALGGEIVAEAVNRVKRDGDISRHAEIIAITDALKRVGRGALRRYTIYANVEPCAMCAFCIREAGLARVVYALESPVMGGYSKWNILRDDTISGRMPQIFGAVPEVARGALAREAQQVWREWNPLAWEMIKLRGLLMEPLAQDFPVHVHSAHRGSFWHALQLLFWRKTPSMAPAVAVAVNQTPL